MLAREYDGFRGSIDQADRADVPSRVANLYQAQVTQPGRDLEAGAAHRLSVPEPVWLEATTHPRLGPLDSAPPHLHSSLQRAMPAAQSCSAGIWRP